ncbi:2163_t:CDS:2, partial [Dentiscutata heterogama]
MSASTPNYMKDYDDIYSIDEEQSRPAESLAHKTKKRKKHDNPSIAWEYFKVETTEKGDFDVCQICKEKNINVKYVHDSSTGNMLSHLWSKHRIDKGHSEEANNNGSIIKAMHQLLDSLILLLKPFYEATNIFSGSSYPTLNLIYPTMRLLIKKFEPSYEQTEEDYAELLFGPIVISQSQLTDNEDSDELDIENEFDILIVSEQLRQPLQPSVTSEELCDLVKAASYLSLQEYWEVPEEVGLIASFLDPRIKNLRFLNNETLKTTIINKVRILCNEEDQTSARPDKSTSILTSEPTTNNDLIAALYSSKEPDDKTHNKNKVDHYLREPIEKMGSRKYLSVPATSVPLERLFSDAGLLITALRNRLHPDMVEQMMFLK